MLIQDNLGLLGDFHDFFQNMRSFQVKFNKPLPIL